MSTLVVKSWRASKTADRAGNFIEIVGRKDGLASWFLSLIKVDETTSIRVSNERVEFISSSLSGTHHRLIPLSNICSTSYGYYKPWTTSAAIFLLMSFPFNIPLWGFYLIGMMEFASIGVLAGAIIATVIALIHYALGQSLTLAFVENSNFVCSIRFKRSVIEGVHIDEHQARLICEMTQDLIEDQTPMATRSYKRNEAEADDSRYAPRQVS